MRKRDAVKLALILFIGWLVIMIALDWVALPFQKLSVENVESQWAFAYEGEEALLAKARQVCQARVVLQDTKDDWAKEQRRTQVVANENAYAKIAADYNAGMRNAFEAKYIKPSDVRERAPVLADLIEFLKSTEGLGCGE